jgi:hypothetical protein
VLYHQIEVQEVQHHERQVLALLCNPTEAKEVLYYKKNVQEVLHHHIEVQELYQQIKDRMCCTVSRGAGAVPPERGAGGAIPSDRRCKSCKHHQKEMPEVLYH